VKSGDPLTLAVSLETPCVVVLPSPTPGKVVLVSIHPKARESTTPSPTLIFEPSRFLGLTDKPVLLDEPMPQPKKRWWQRKKAA
jgi:hypothetical protein